jgi:hypothetical protein
MIIEEEFNELTLGSEYIFRDSDQFMVDYLHDDPDSHLLGSVGILEIEKQNVDNDINMILKEA